MFVLGADVGGTKTAMALANVEGDLLVRRVYPSQSYAGLGLIVDTFMQDPDVRSAGGAAQAACIAVAGPVSGGTTRLTNLGWNVSAAELSAQLGGIPVELINDFAAVGHGIQCVPQQDLICIQTGDGRPYGNRLVIGAGTGLGVGYLTWSGNRYDVHASEGGHVDFAPTDVLQDKLLAYLRNHFDRVSVERVVSGPGLLRIFSFLQDSGGGAPSKSLIEAMRTMEDPAGAIAEAAMARTDMLAVRALELFCTAYGAVAGNAALTLLPTGGVYVAGGIAPKIAPKLLDGAFIRAFTGKGRFTELLAGLPVHIVANADVGLLGAVEAARRMRA